MKKVTLVLAALAGVITTGAQAQSYPTRPITMIVPFAAGGPTDVIARIVGDHMSRMLGSRSWSRTWRELGGPPASHVAPSLSPMAIPS
jgi:hypothetical protein